MEEINESLYDRILDFDSTRKAEWMRNRKPYAVLFELTPRCNFGCIHCYLQNNHNDKDVLSTEQIKDILDVLCEKGILFITFTGGEILSRSDFCDIYLYAKKKGFFVELFTNGYLLSAEIIKILQEYPPLLVSISLYGATDEIYHKVTGVQGAFTKVIANCRKLVDAGIRISLKSPILSITEPEMEQMQKVAESLGQKIVFSFEIHGTINGTNEPLDYRTSLKSMLEYEFKDYLSRISEAEVDKIEDNTRKLQNDPHIFNCNVAMNSFVIDYNGNMLPCMKLRHKGVSLFENQFDEIWENFKVYKEYLVSSANICKKCDAIYFCDTCPAEKDFICGDYEKRDCNDCKAAKIRELFYKGKIDYDEAIKMADL